MSWQGIIEGEAQRWGAEGAAHVLHVGAAGVPVDRVPGPLLPEVLQQGGGAVHLPPLGPLPAPERLALIGFHQMNPNWDGVAVVVTDRATLWVTLSADEVIHIQGSATPALIGALGLPEAGEGFGPALDRPERLPLLLHDAANGTEQAALLIGADIGATRTIWLGQQAVLIAEGALAKGYGHGLSAAHVPVTLTRQTALREAGFAALAAKHLPSA
ncbi:hypothetical protein ACRARG_13770 [Pseudooceanicola sp. C21-150M6]|uniref:hypothetical protein n=1 Tax=Pseudooceanicola sp. C21-150M6 TaxID=3434355 RepID=UPI003D7FD14A